MSKRVYYSEIVFTNEFYIDGINIFDSNNVEFVKNIDIDLKMNLSFSKINNAKVFKIKKLGFKIGIAHVRDFKIICYLNWNMFFKVSNHPKDYESIHKNYTLLEGYAISKIKESLDDNMVYSSDYRTRAFISNNNGLVSLKYQRLEIEDEKWFYFYEDVNSNNFWTWEDVPGISYFDTLDNAKKEAITSLKNYNSDSYRYHKEPNNIIWEYILTRFETFLYMMKYIIIVPISVVLLSCLMPISGITNWNFMWLSSGCSTLALLISILAIWLNGYTISYFITDKGIGAVKGLYRECSFENIKKIKIRRSLFNKNKGSIKFKLHKGFSYNFNFDHIDNYKEAYEIIKENLTNN